MDTPGQRIKAAREKAKLSVPDLAKACDVSRQAVYQWEKDDTIPTADNFLSIAQKTGESISVLIRGRRISKVDEYIVAEATGKYHSPSVDAIHDSGDRSNADELAAIGAALEDLKKFESSVRSELEKHQQSIADTLDSFRNRFQGRFEQQIKNK